MLAAGLAYLRPLLLDETFAARDHLLQTLPSREYLAGRLRGGQLPEWWDAIRLGERYAGEPNNGVTYPPAWLVALGDPLWCADLVFVLHVLLAGLGGLLLARRLGVSRLGAFFSGAALMLSGYVTSMVVNGEIILSVGWLPMVAWAALGVARAEDRRSLASSSLVFAAILSASLTTGNPASFNGAVLAATVVAVAARRPLCRLGALAGAGLLAALMGAVTLLPTLMTLRDSVRGGGFRFAESAAWSMHPLRMLEWVWPEALGQGLRPERNLGEVLARGGGAGLEAFWSGSLYVGLPVLLCVVLAAVRGGSLARRLALLSLGFVVIALGSFTPGYAVYRFLVWPERLLRYPEKHFASALVLWTALAGLGLDLLFRREASRRTILLSALPAGVLALATAVVWSLRAPLANHVLALSRQTGHGLLADAALSSVTSGGKSAAMLSGLLPLALLLTRRPRLAGWAAPLLVLATVCDLIGHDWSVHIMVARDSLRARPALLASLPRPEPGQWPRVLWRAKKGTPVTMPGEARALMLHHTAVQNDAGRFGFGQLPGFEVVDTVRFDQLVQASGTAPLERVMDLLDVRYLILPAAETGHMGMPVVSPEPIAGEVVLENLDRRPRTFVAYRWHTGLGDQQALAELFQPRRADVDLGAIRISSRLDGSAPKIGNSALEPTPCTLERPRPEHVILHCQAEANGWAVLTDEWTAGWTATVDGTAAPVERADLLLRAVPVGAGQHTIELRYRTPGLRLGCLISLLGWLAFALLGYRMGPGRAAGSRDASSEPAARPGPIPTT